MGGYSTGAFPARGPVCPPYRPLGSSPTADNPCRHVRSRHTEKPRIRYVTDDEFAAVYEIAPEVIQLAMLLALITGLGELVQAGVVLASNYEVGTDLLITRLNRIKPDMIAEATANARKAAEQFARDTDSRIGAIRHARQGLFTIQDLDRYSPEIKRVRVVTKVEFFITGD